MVTTSVIHVLKNLHKPFIVIGTHKIVIWWLQWGIKIKNYEEWKTHKKNKIVKIITMVCYVSL